ncbi:HNH endonuclease signature motif containing protein [Corynebacterium sp. S7]
MNAFEHFAAQWGQAMDILAAAFGRSVFELCQAGLDTKMAKQVDKLGEVYFGKTKSTRKQARARGFAGKQGHTLFTLAEIETIVGRLKDKKHAWKVREELCKEAPIMRQIQERGKELIAEFNGPEVPVNKPSVSATAIPGSTYVNFRACAPGHLVQAAMDALHAEESDEHVAVRAMNILAGGGSAGGPPITPAVVISLDNLAKVVGYEGDDVILSLTNGTRMTGKDFVEATLTEKGFVMLVDPVEGPVNVYYASRVATPKQRLMRSICDPVCVGDGCGVGADYCQMNHNVAWSAGGPTNINNLSTMCKFHNGRMDDDRGSPLHGHVDQVDGQVYFFPPFGGKPRLNDHPVARGGAMRLV